MATWPITASSEYRVDQSERLVRKVLNYNTISFQPVAKDVGKGRVHGSKVGCLHTVAVGGNGTVYLSESEYHHVSVFSPTCQHIGGKGEGSGKLDQPMGVAVDLWGMVFVCDYNNCCIQFSTTHDYQSQHSARTIRMRDWTVMLTS